MRIKNFTLLVLMGLFGLFTTNLFAQEDATIAPEDIKFWIGEGSHQVRFIVNWAEPDTALAWGYRFEEESVTIKDLMDKIADNDYRFTFEANGSWMNDIHFNDGILNLSLVTPGWVMYLVNGEAYWDTFDEKTLVDGDYVKWGDTDCGTLVDPDNYIYVWEEEVVAVYPLAEEATIDPSEILYWVGEGPNQVIFAVNFADPQVVCFAWGYRFSTDDVIIKHMMDDIAASDGRFDYQADENGWLTEITLMMSEADPFTLAGYNAMFNLNGVAPWHTFDEVTVHDGDFVKWGDFRVATEIAQWTYVWETPVTPVPVYNTSVNESNATMSLYPNPATTYTMLEAGMTNATVTVSDLQGRVIRTFVADGDEAVRIETEGFQAGLYFVTVTDGTNCQTLKLSVK